MSDPGLHATHPEIINRLKRTDGHLKSVVQMIEAGRPCLDIAQQLHAVEAAIAQAKKTLIHDHLDHCLEAALGPLEDEQKRDIEAFRRITKFL